ncbi:hypothetical protein AB5I41_13655 [Sphingomonas sp. MMS24-JH45]
MPIATGVIDRELAAKGVTARYHIADLGLGRQRLTDVVIGDPRDPDLRRGLDRDGDRCRALRPAAGRCAGGACAARGGSSTDDCRWRDRPAAARLDRRTVRGCPRSTSRSTTGRCGWRRLMAWRG